MKNKTSLRTGIKPLLTLKRIALFTSILLIAGGIFWKVFLTGAAVTMPQALFGQYTPASGPVITGQTWERPIVVNHSQVMDTVDLIDFPLLVSFSDPDLRSTSNGGFVVSVDGHDIVFTGDGDKQLDHEIEKYDASTGQIVAWVRLPILYHQEDTELKISCGNPTLNTAPPSENVWNSNYKAVWHMHQDPSSTNQEDACDDYDAVSHGNMPSSSLNNGIIGDAVKMDGSNDYYSIKDLNYQGVGQTTSLCVSAWVKTNFNNSTYNSNWSIVDFDRTKHYNFYVHGTGMLSFSSTGNGTLDLHGGAAGQVNNNEWHHVAATFNGNTKSVYIDGVLVGTQANVHPNGIGSTNKRYGMIGDGSQAAIYNGSRYNKYYDGWIDELRISETCRSTGWLQTEYNNQNSPETFYSLGATNYLPVELVFFNAQVQNNTVVVDWATASQKNNDYFNIERSLDGNTFENLAEVDGLGNSQSYKAYQWIDENPQSGISYYRLRQTDFDGKYEVFLPVSVKYLPEVKGVELLNVSPNPFSEYVNIRFRIAKETELDVILMNSNGVQVFSDQIFTQEGENTYTFHADGMIAPGMYYLMLSQNGSVLVTQKVMKK